MKYFDIGKQKVVWILKCKEHDKKRNALTPNRDVSYRTYPITITPSLYSLLLSITRILWLAKSFIDTKSFFHRNVNHNKYSPQTIIIIVIVIKIHDKLGTTSVINKSSTHYQTSTSKIVRCEDLNYTACLLNSVCWCDPSIPFFFLVFYSYFNDNIYDYSFLIKSYIGQSSNKALRL